ncbi:hypothetical protein M422DRAFT_781104 [Sphaerobolus stellatus SS14]|uniref:Unplaced genomic scaffold SPHSTscaffold_78, whole genome shotgun sequence n=1 Tax=Sphaerobolus stellatus (strain SS14) TaxID=990650 RepID=A0A0C9U8B6_SPHS4|nr:hypothetical protein M422DRAFT_781104 [Sphaerobolus stellatus SS14]
MSQPKVWLITGTSSGFGRAVTEHVLANGGIVVATLRKPEAIADLAAKYDSSRLLVLKLDVKNPEEIKSVFAKVKETYGRLDVVYNNAGYAVLAEAEATPVDTARDMFEVNFWGLINVTKEALRFFREVNKPGVGGWLLNASSMAGIAGLPAMSFYSASKYAVEGFSESVSKELKPEWNIKVGVIAFGNFHTNAVQGIVDKDIPSLPAYEGGVVTSMRSAFDPNGGKSPKKAARELYNLTINPKSPSRVRLLLGDDTIGLAKGQLKQLQEDIDVSEPITDLWP